MTITINIDDASAERIIGNIALSQGWTLASVEQGRELTAELLGKQVNDLAVAGELVRVRNEQQAAVREIVTNGVSVS